MLKGLRAEFGNRLLRPQEVADYLGVPKNTLYGWKYRGSGPRTIRVGRHLRYHAADIDEWVEQQTEPRAN